ncbi:MAG TPA: GlsB/YeaQ/YmgE family stress response membrane protein [Solirubrobacterales bacterium]
MARAVREGCAGGRRDIARLGHVRILERVEVERPAVGVFGPDAAAAGDGAAVEGRGVVGRHAAVVVGAVGIDQVHLADREAQPVERAHRLQHCRGGVAVDDQPAPVGPPVEPPVADPEQAQICKANRAATMPGDAGHPRPGAVLNGLGRTVEGQVFTTVPPLRRGCPAEGQDDGESEAQGGLHEATFSSETGERPCFRPRRCRVHSPRQAKWEREEELMGIIGWIVLGLCAGAIAKLIMPGDDPGGIIVTTLIGIAGAIIGGLIASALDIGDLDEFFDIGTWLIAIAGSLLLLFIYRMIIGNRTTGRGAYR